MPLMSARDFTRHPPLPHSFFDRPADAVAPELLGKLMIRKSPEGVCVGRIVETEAYLSSHDPACHAHKGQTRKNSSMFGPPGNAYVYSIHACWCFNIVTEPETFASAVLIRALEPLCGIELMQARRGTEKLFDLARGPGRLCEALDVTKEFDGWDLSRKRSLWIADEGFIAPSPMLTSGRIGISLATELPLRYFYAGNRFVSGKRSTSQDKA